MLSRSSEQTQRIQSDIEKKIVILTGPRQVGKTTLSKAISRDYQYLNYDSLEHRTVILRKEWDRKKHLIILDEIHKRKKWKSWIKGIYDTEEKPPHFFITGSARLDVIRKTGDSLAGRYFQHRLHPFDLRELRDQRPIKDSFQRLMSRGGFPEPFLAENDDEARRWRKTHLDLILRQDLADLETVRNIHAIETLVLLLRERVGNGVSYASLARDLEVDPKTIKNWIRILEELYVIFVITPYTNSSSRSLLKEPKIYFYDNGQVIGDEGRKFENLVACALLKDLHRIEDLYGYDVSLNYLKNKEKKEVDFILSVDRKPVLMLEAKWNDSSISKGLAYYADYFRSKKSHFQTIQLVGTEITERTTPSGLEIRSAMNWLPHLNLLARV